MRLLKFIDTLCQLAFRCASLCTLILVILTTEQVIARYVFHASSIAMQELEWYLFGVCITLPIAYCYRTDTHVRVDFLSRSFSPSVRLWRERVGIALLILTLSSVLWYSVPYALESFSFKNPRPADYYTSGFLSDSNSWIYQFSTSIESFIRSTILAGEISPDPGGLEARWIIKALFPAGLALLILQCIRMLFSTFLKTESSEHGS